MDEECDRTVDPSPGIEFANENSTNSLNRLNQVTLDNAAKFNHSTQSLPRAATNTEFQPSETAMRAGSLTRNSLAMMQAKAMTLKELPLDIRPQVNRFVTYHASGSDSGNGSGDSVQSPAASDFDGGGLHHQQRGVVIRTPHFFTNSMSSITLKSLADVDYAALEQNLLAMEVNDIQPSTRFDLENFTTLLLPSVENQPLDKDALTTIRMILNETAPRMIADCISRIDIKLILSDVVGECGENGVDGGENGTSQDQVFKCSGIELLTLAHGKQFRMDLIERTECIRLIVAVTILTCADDLERAETLDKWIQIANDTKTAVGNLYGFGNVMMGLCMPQVSFLHMKFSDFA